MNGVFVVEGIIFEGEFLVVWLDGVQDEEADSENDDYSIIEYVSVNIVSNPMFSALASLVKYARENDFRGEESFREGGFPRQ